MAVSAILVSAIFVLSPLLSSRPEPTTLGSSPAPPDKTLFLLPSIHPFQPAAMRHRCGGGGPRQNCTIAAAATLSPADSRFLFKFDQSGMASVFCKSGKSLVPLGMDDWGKFLCDGGRSPQAALRVRITKGPDNYYMLKNSDSFIVRNPKGELVVDEAPLTKGG